MAETNSKSNQTQNWWQDANTHYKAKRWNNAKKLYQQILSIDAKHLKAINALGMTLAENGELNDAFDLLNQSILEKSDYAPFYLNRGLLHKHLKQFDKAIADFNLVIALSPNIIGAYSALGNTFETLQKWDNVVTTYQKALKRYPGQNHFLTKLGTAYLQKSKYQEAINYYQKALKLKPNCLEALCNAGVACNKIQFAKQSIQFFEKALEINPNLPSLHNNLGNAYTIKREHNKALLCYQKTLKLNPNHLKSMVNMGGALLGLNQPKEAIKIFKKAIKLAPNSIGAYCGYAKALLTDDQHNKSEKILEKILTLHPDNAILHANIACYYKDKLNFKKALAYLQKALVIDPNHACSKLNEAMCLLTLGNFSDGWEKYQCRFEFIKKQIPPYNYQFKNPIWKGESLENKTLYVYMEQGFGDIIQFIRYLPLLTEYADKIIVESRPPLLKLFEANFFNVEFVPRGEVKDADYYVPLLNLPAIFKTTLETIPYSQGYLSTPKKHRLKHFITKNEKKLNVGIAWAGNKRYSADYKRSMSLELLKPLLNKRSIQFYSLQVGEHEKDIETFKLQKKLINLSPNIKDFTDTAVLIDQLDLVIAVDTGVAHLAGSLNKPIWIMIPFSPDFRWMLDRSDSPWYDSVRLFRQPEPGDWKSVIENVCKALKKLLKTL